MNKEIKKILEHLKYKCLGPKELELKDCEVLLDYITNLQEENQYLNNELNNMTDYAKDLQQENERKERLITQYGEGMCAYANRIEKAIEYMQENYNELTDYGYKKEIYDDLLNILQNGSEKDG